MPTRCNRGFYCISYRLLNMFRGITMPIIRSSRVAACGISYCKNVKKNNFVSFCGICVLSLKCRVLSRFVTGCVECRGGCVWVFLVDFFLVVYSLVCGSAIPFVGCDCMTVDVDPDNTRHLRLRTQIPQKLTKLFLQHKIPHAATTV